MLNTTWQTVKDWLTYNPPPLLGERSHHWPTIRASHLKKEPRCQACGTSKLLNVHHIIPYHLNPTLELLASNLITLCETPSRNCHFALGHLLDWRAYNPSIRLDAAVYYEMVVSRLYALPTDKK